MVVILIVLFDGKFSFLLPLSSQPLGSVADVRRSQCLGQQVVVAQYKHRGTLAINSSGLFTPHSGRKQDPSQKKSLAKKRQDLRVCTIKKKRGHRNFNLIEESRDQLNPTAATFARNKEDHVTRALNRYFEIRFGHQNQIFIALDSKR